MSPEPADARDVAGVLRGGALGRLLIGVALAFGTSLPVVAHDTVVSKRFHHWALFAGGLLVGGELGAARIRLR